MTLGIQLGTWHKKPVLCTGNGFAFSTQYSKKYHKGLSEMYVAGVRFLVNYDKLAPSCIKFLRDAINVYCK
ncbi:MAG: hypothetical protein GX334_00210 [Firmicutes bacterium]|nr:hypothetical protein [Bacillota bacterium]